MYNTRKWNRLCISYDFVKNEGQLAFSGHVSHLVQDPHTDINMNGGMLILSSASRFNTGKFDGDIITGASPDSELFLTVGRYFFDKNPFIGSMADISVWNR